MKQFFKIIVWIIYINTILVASNKIVLGSFKDQVVAEKYLKTISKSLESNEQIDKIDFKNDLYFIIRESLVFDILMVTLEPFDDDAILQSTLKEIRKTHLDAYNSRVKTTRIFLKKKFMMRAIKDTKTSEKKTPLDIQKKLEIVEKNIELEKSKEKSFIAIAKKDELVQKNVVLKEVLRQEKSLEKIAMRIYKEEKYGLWILFVLFIYVFIFYWLTRDKEEDEDEDAFNIQTEGTYNDIEIGSAIVKNYPIFVSPNIDMYIGLKNFKRQQDRYIAAIDRFIYEYYFATMAIQEMMNSQRYDEAQELIINIKKASSLLGAEKLSKIAKAFQGAFKNKHLEKSRISMNSFYEALDVLLKDIKTYREENT